MTNDDDAAQSAPDIVPVGDCGRRWVPALHLLEADDTLTQPSWRVGSQQHVALCGAQVDESTPIPDYAECPGCGDCTHYCAHCVRVAAEHSEQPL